MTPDDRVRAYAEGWVIHDGQIKRTFDKYGSSPFINDLSATIWVRDKAETSEWHREMFFSYRLTLHDCVYLVGFSFSASLIRLAAEYPDIKDYKHVVDFILAQAETGKTGFEKIARHMVKVKLKGT